MMQEPRVYRRALAALLLAALAPAAASAATYYVSTGGSDSASGSSSQPFRTIRRGMGALSAGDTLYVRSGTYGEVLDSNAFTIPSGTSWNAVATVAAEAGNTVVLNPSIAGGAIINLAHSYIKYLVFDGLILDALNAQYAVSMINGANHVRFRNCEVKNATWDGIILVNGTGGTDYNEFIGLSIHDVGLSGRGHGMYIQTSNNLVDRCNIFNNAKFGIQIYNGYSGERANSNTVRNTKFRNDGYSTADTGGALTINSGTGNVAYNNVIWSCWRGIDTLWGSPSGTKIYNNTIYSNRGPGIEVGAAAAAAVVQNNIVWSNDSAITNNGSATILSNNLTSDPKFVDAAGSNFKLQPTSGAIDTGIAIGTVLNDILGVLRPQGVSYDIGAYEYQVSAISAPKNLKVISPSQ